MDLKKIKVDFKDPVTIATIVGSVLLLFASFLPIETAKVLGESTSRNLMGEYKHQGIILLILAIACVVILILSLDREKILNAALGTTAAVGLWGIINGITGLNATKKEFKGAGDLATTSFSIGFFALVLGVIAIGAAIVLISMNAKKSTPAQPAQPTQPMQ